MIKMKHVPLILVIVIILSALFIVSVSAAGEKIPNL